MQPITQTCEIVTGSVHSREERAFCRRFRYEVTQVQDCNSPTDTFHEIIVPIDFMDDCLIMQANQLANLRCVTFQNPRSPNLKTFMDRQATNMTLLNILRIRSLTEIALCADLLDHDVFRALGSHSCLREVRLIPPTPSISNPNRVVQIGMVLNKGIPQLLQMEYFKIPVAFVTHAVLSALGRLPSLRYLEFAGSGDVPHPRYFFVECLDPLHPRPPGCFQSLKLLKIDEKIPREIQQMLSNAFSNVRFVGIQ